jgi:hypothetical protein
MVAVVRGPEEQEALGHANAEITMSAHQSTSSR